MFFFSIYPIIYLYSFFRMINVGFFDGVIFGKFTTI